MVWIKPLWNLNIMIKNSTNNNREIAFNPATRHKCLSISKSNLIRMEKVPVVQKNYTKIIMEKLEKTTKLDRRTVKLIMEKFHLIQ